MNNAENIYGRDISFANSDEQLIKQFESDSGLPEAQTDLSIQTNKAVVQPEQLDYAAEEQKIIEAFEGMKSQADAAAKPTKNGDGEGEAISEKPKSPTQAEFYETLRATYGGNFLGDLAIAPFGTTEVGEMTTQVFASVADAVQETGNALIFGADALDNWLKEKGLTKEEFIQKPTRLDFVEKSFPQPTETADRVTRSVAKYLIPAYATRGLVGKGATGAMKASAVVAGFNFIATDPKEERLSNIVQESGPGFMKPLAQYLAAEKDDPEFLGRMKSAAESLLVDATLAGAFVGVAKGYKGARALKNQFIKADEKVIEKAVSEFEKIKPSVEVDPVKIDGTKFKVNVERLTDEDDLRGFIGNFVEKNKDAINVSRRGTVSDPELMAGAGKIAADPEAIERLVTLPPGSTVSAEEKLVIDKMFVDVAEQMQSFVKSFDPEKATMPEWKAFNDYLIAMDKLSKVSYATSAEAGRTLRATQLVSKMPSAMKARYTMEQIKLMGGEGNLKKIAGVLKDISDAPAEDFVEKMGKVMQKSTGRKIFDAALEVRMNGLVSSPKSFLTGVISPMLITGPAAILERGIGRVWSVATKDKNGVAKGEVGQMVGAYASESGRVISSIYGGFEDWVKQAAGSIRDGEFGEFIKTRGRDGVKSLKELGRNPPPRMQYGTAAEPGDLAPAISSKSFGMDPDGFLGGVVDMASGVIRSPTYALSRSDQVVGQIHYNMEKRALAMRELARRNIDPTSKEGQGLFANLISDMPESVDVPWFNEAAKNIKEQGMRFAEANKFTAQLDGIAGQIDSLIKADIAGAPWLRLFIPFSRVELNVLTYGLERFPGLAMLSSRVREDLAAGGARAALAKSKMAMGGMFMFSGSLLAMNGLITGNGPRNKDMRKLLEQNGWQPNSIKIGDTYYRHDRIADPFSSFLSMSADVADIAHSAQEAKPQEYQQMIAASSLIVTETLTPEFLTRNFADLLEAVDPNNEKPMSQYVVQQLVKGQVPFSALVREVRRTGMPADLVPGDRIIRETFADSKNMWSGLEEMKNAIVADLPYFSESLPPRRNLWGEPVVYPAGFGPDSLSPIATMTEPKGQRKLVMDELSRLGVAGKAFHPQAPDGEQYLIIKQAPKSIKKNIAGQTILIDMSPEQYDKYVQLAAGHGLKSNFYPMGRPLTLEQALAEEIKNNYPNLGAQKNKQNKRLIISQIVSKYREAAAAQLQIEDPGLNQRYIDQMQRVVNIRSALEEAPTQ